MSIARGLAQSIAKPLARSLSGLGSGGGPTPLDILAHVGTSTSPTSTGTKAVTGVGFEPKLLMPFGGLITSSTNATGGYLGLGAMTAAAQAAVSVSTLNGLTTSNTDRRHDNADAVSQIIDGTVDEEAARSALGTDGFTLNWTTAAAAANILNHICLGGDDLEVSLTQHQMNNTNAPQSFAHGLSGAPTGLLLFSASISTAPPNTSGTLGLGLGAWTEANQFGKYLYGRNSVSTSGASRILSNSIVYSVHGSTSTTLRSMAVASVDATNVNVTYPVTTITDQIYFWLLAIRGAKCQVGTFDCNGSLDPLTIATPGITPKLALFFFVPSGVDSINTVQNDLLFAIGASDGTNNTSCGISDANGVTTTNARRYQSSTTLVEYNTAGTKTFEATAAFDGESVVIDPTVNSGTSHGQGSFLIIGA